VVIQLFSVYTTCFQLDSQVLGGRGKAGVFLQLFQCLVHF
jgi:hypothetical protein